MSHTLLMLCLGLLMCPSAFSQTPGPAGPTPTPPPTLILNLQDAMERARANSPQILSASISALLAREDTVQAKAGLLPSAAAFSQYIYTQPNGLPSGVFVSNDGPHIYNNQLQVHGDIYAPAKLADYRKTQVAEAVARAKSDLALRGLVATVTESYYGMVSAMRKLANAQQSQREAEQFLDITRKQERGGEVAHSDSVKAEIEVLDRQRDTRERRTRCSSRRAAVG